MTLAGTKCASGRLNAYFIPIKMTLMLEFNIQYSGWTLSFSGKVRWFNSTQTECLSSKHKPFTSSGIIPFCFV